MNDSALLNPSDAPARFPRTKTYGQRKTNDSETRYRLIALLPVLSSMICAVYVVLFYHQIQSMGSTMDQVSDLLTSINQTRTKLIIDNLLALEECVLKLPMC